MKLTQIVAEKLERSHPVRDRRRDIMPGRRDEPERYAIQPAYDPEHDLARMMVGDLTVRVPATAVPKLGEQLALAVDIDQLYFFDRSGDQNPAPARRPAPARPSASTYPPYRTI